MSCKQHPLLSRATQPLSHSVGRSVHPHFDCPNPKACNMASGCPALFLGSGPRGVDDLYNHSYRGNFLCPSVCPYVRPYVPHPARPSGASARPFMASASPCEASASPCEASASPCEVPASPCKASASPSQASTSLSKVSSSPS